MAVNSILDGFSVEQLLDALSERYVKVHDILDHFATWQLLDELDNRKGIESVGIESGGRMTIEVRGPAIAYFVDQRSTHDEDAPGIYEERDDEYRYDDEFVEVLDEVYENEEEEDKPQEPYDELSERRRYGPQSWDCIHWTISDGAEHVIERQHDRND